MIAFSVTLPSWACFQYLPSTQKGNSAGYLTSFSWYIPSFGLKTAGVPQTCLPGHCLCCCHGISVPVLCSPFLSIRGRLLPNKPLLISSTLVEIRSWRFYMLCPRSFTAVTWPLVSPLALQPWHFSSPTALLVVSALTFLLMYDYFIKGPR